MDFAELEALAQILSTGFEALLNEVRTQREFEKALREKIAYAAHEYEALRDLSYNQKSLHCLEVLDQLENDPTKDMKPLTTVPLKDVVSTDPQIESAWQASKQLRRRTSAKEQDTVRKCPAIRHTIDQEDFEHDFTTPGVQGNLDCPFARMAVNGLPHTPNSTVDPIAAEFHPDKISVVSPDAAAQGVGKCPIRFLDQHTPEEVAKYFENHKHEIPRSHEICVKRYQANESSIRELDEKYGNLVNMIQGLGVKHKQYLPEKDGATGDSERRDHSSTRAVEKWAEDISHKAESVEPDPGYEADEEERTGHFEKPLREIRVGESPSRPWGIQIPLDKEIARSADSEAPALAHPADPSQVNDTAAAPRCPFGHGKLKQKAGDPVFAAPDEDHALHGHAVDDDQSANKPGQGKEQSNKAGRHQVIFNGPIVLGYSPDQAMAFLQALKGL